jgi:hypothetical protein
MREECSVVGCSCAIQREPDISEEYSLHCENLKFDVQNDSSVLLSERALHKNKTATFRWKHSDRK